LGELSQHESGGADDGADEMHVPDDCFIPVEASDIVAAIQEDAARFGPLAAGIAELACAMEAVVDLEAAGLRRALHEVYRPHNPDRDTIRPGGARRPHDSTERVWASLRRLVTKANFARLGESEIEQALREANSHGVRIRLREEAVERLELYARGNGTLTRRRRHWRAPIRGREQAYEVCRRFVVIGQMKERSGVEIKLFRDIPVADLESLLPHAQVQMGWLDRAQVAVGGAGALGGVAMKVVQGGALLASQMTWPLVFAFGGLSFRSFMGYRRAMRTRAGQRTQHLYFKNLANNAAAVHALVAMVCGEELKEAILGYAFLACWESEEPRSERTLRETVERWLAARFGVEVCFDAPDALETMHRLDLWDDEAALRPLTPPEAAAERLLRHVASPQAAGYHLEALRENHPLAADAAPDG